MKKLLILSALVFTLILTLTACDFDSLFGGNVDHTHAFGEWKIIEDSTCTKDGIKVRSCACGEIESGVVEKAHTYKDWVCTRCGYVLPGLFDADNNLVASWETLVNDYGMDVSKDYEISNSSHADAPSYVLSYDKFSAGVKLVIADDVTSIGARAFWNCTQLTSIIIPDSVTTIGKCAFYGCESLVSVEIGNGVTSIGQQAFYLCKSLKSVTIPDSVKSIEHYAFLECSSLTGVKIGKGVTSIGVMAFASCPSLTAISVDENNEHYSSIDGNLYSKDGKSLIKYVEGKTDPYFVVPECVTSIEDESFYDCSSLVSVEIGKNVTNIGAYAFYYCSALAAFSVDENNENYCSIGGNIYSKDGKALVRYAEGKTKTTFDIPDGVITANNGAFYNCQSLQAITIPDSVTSIGEDAFVQCFSLVSIIIPDGVTCIEAWAFSNCSSLTSITIPSSVTSFGTWALYGCESLSTISFDGTVEQWSVITKGENWNHSTGEYTVQCTNGTIPKSE